MRLLLVHNRYQIPGGEDQVYASELSLLRQHGHSVETFEESNDRIVGLHSLQTAVGALWNHPAYRSISRLVRATKAKVVHFHNTFPLISPAAYYAAQSEGAAVVQTLHNFRLLCPGATLFRNGSVCEECIEKKSLRPAMKYGCYRGSRSATAAVATMLQVHRAAGTWQHKVDLYIAPSEFSRQKFIEGGLPGSRIVVKPNFVSPDPGLGKGLGGYALFAGRLSPEKGISVLECAWKALKDVPLMIAGDGPLGFCGSAGHATLLGRQSREQVQRLMQDAQVLIFPSQCYEGAPMALIEAFACGLPVIASNLGAMAEMVDHQRTGLLFAPGDAADLAQKVRWAVEHPEAMETMRAAARSEFEKKYTADRNYEMLVAIYETAIANSKRERRAAS